MIYLQLFLSFLQIGAFSFGGGYAAMPLIQNEVVKKHAWISISEFTDLITISQMTPGPIAVNAATFVGIKIAGIKGAIVATLGCILPACIFVTLLAYIYVKYKKLDSIQSVLKMLRPAVVAMIAASGLLIIRRSFFGDKLVLLNNLNIKAVGIFILCLVLIMKFKKNPIMIMVLAGVINLFIKFGTQFLTG